MLQQDEPDDFVIATGKQISVRDFVNAAFAEVDIQIDWQGSGVDEQGQCKKTGNTLVQVDPKYFRPTEVETLLGNPQKAKDKLGWEPKITLEEMVSEMVREDIHLAKKDEYCIKEGFKVFNYLNNILTKKFR